MEMKGPNNTVGPRVAKLLLVAALVASPVALALLPHAALAASTVNVSISNYAFSPSSITVVIGVNNTVTWTNNDPVTHTVTADDKSFDQTLTSGQTFTQTFTTAGTFTYHCTIHTYMTGTVKVLNPSSSTGASSTNTPSGGVPEFSFGGVAVVITTLVVLASYLALRQTRRS